MKHVLIIDCCIRGKASRTGRLLKAFLENLPEGFDTHCLKLCEEELSWLSPESLAARDALIAKRSFDHPRFKYARQFAEADLIVVAAPFWDLSFPALLKVYIEQISVDGITFGTGEKGLVGLCRAKDLFFITTRGGIYAPGTGLEDLEMGSRYIEALCVFFGIDRYHLIDAEGLDIVGFDMEGILAEAEERAAAAAGSIEV